MEKERKEFCPECGNPLTFAYERENGEKIYYCKEGDEHYKFENKGEYRYAECLSNGQRFCVGIAK